MCSTWLSWQHSPSVLLYSVTATPWADTGAVQPPLPRVPASIDTSCCTTTSSLLLYQSLMRKTVDGHTAATRNRTIVTTNPHTPTARARTCSCPKHHRSYFGRQHHGFGHRTAENLARSHIFNDSAQTNYFS